MLSEPSRFSPMSLNAGEPRVCCLEGPSGRCHTSVYLELQLDWRFMSILIQTRELSIRKRI
jgi:hypothetical protein